MTIKSNSHTHCQWCDGANTAEEMVQAAIALGFTDLGFSSHSPAPFDLRCPGMVDEAGYRADIQKLKEKYADKLTILCGVEQDTFARVDQNRYDYVITSVHYLPLVPGQAPVAVDGSAEELQAAIAQRYGGNAMAMLQTYFDLVVQSVAETRPTIVGHFDLPKKFNSDGRLFDEESPAYRQMALEAFDAVLDIADGYGGMVEINTGAFARGLRTEFYPAPFLLRHGAQCGARFTVNSDSHATQTLNAGFERALPLLRETGNRTVTVLQQGCFVEKQL